MQTFTALLQRFGSKGEKNGLATLGWTYFAVPADVAEALKPGQKTSFRVKGTLDNYTIEQVALVPMGQSEYDGADGLAGRFIIAVNATVRRGIGKEEGATVRVSLMVDDSPMPVSADLLVCLDDDPQAMVYYQTLPPGHQRYYHNWIEEAKTPHTKAKRIMQAVMGFSMGMGYGEMIRYFKKREE